MLEKSSTFVAQTDKKPKKTNKRTYMCNKYIGFVVAFCGILLALPIKALNGIMSRQTWLYLDFHQLRAKQVRRL